MGEGVRVVGNRVPAVVHTRTPVRGTRIVHMSTALVVRGDGHRSESAGARGHPGETAPISSRMRRTHNRRGEQLVSDAQEGPANAHKLSGRTELFPQRYGARRRVMFRAALEVGIAQRAFAALAGLRAAGLIKRPDRLAQVR